MNVLGEAMAWRMPLTMCRVPTRMHAMSNPVPRRMYPAYRRVHTRRHASGALLKLCTPALRHRVPARMHAPVVPLAQSMPCLCRRLSACARAPGAPVEDEEPPKSRAVLALRRATTHQMTRSPPRLSCALRLGSARRSMPHCRPCGSCMSQAAWRARFCLLLARTARAARPAHGAQRPPRYSPGCGPPPRQPCSHRTPCML